MNMSSWIWGWTPAPRNPERTRPTNNGGLRLPQRPRPWGGPCCVFCRGRCCCCCCLPPPRWKPAGGARSQLDEAAPAPGGALDGPARRRTAHWLPRFTISSWSWSSARVTPRTPAARTLPKSTSPSFCLMRALMPASSSQLGGSVRCLPRGLSCNGRSSGTNAGCFLSPLTPGWGVGAGKAPARRSGGGG